MKKLVILGTAILALNAIASEIQIKGGYDISRNWRRTFNDMDARIKQGFDVNLDYLFDNQGEFEWGVGGEYKFDLKARDNEDNDEFSTKIEKGDRLLRVAPVYALGKFNVITTKSGNDALYVLGRVGYGFAKDTKAKKETEEIGDNYSLRGGLYTAGGIGTEFGPVSLEALYERSAIREKVKHIADNKTRVSKSRGHLDTFGIRLGLRLGNLVNDRKPKIVTEHVEKVVQVPVVREVQVPIVKEIIKEVEVPVVKEVQVPVVKEVQVPVEVNTKTVVLPFSCSVNERKCVIRGFKVDGREPNATEAADLRTIASVINQFADGGLIDFVGHTDSTGTAAYNQKLSVARAQNVAKLLKDYGIKNTVSYGKIEGKGLTQPSDTNKTVQGRYNNRRVELFFDNVDFSNVTFTQQ